MSENAEDKMIYFFFYKANRLLDIVNSIKTDWIHKMSEDSGGF